MRIERFEKRRSGRTSSASITYLDRGKRIGARPGLTKKTRYGAVILGSFTIAVTLLLAPILRRLDYGKLPSRESWQLPDRVIEVLAIEAGDRVADIGAGDGYFSFRLADAVGPTGRVYATDVDEAVLRELGEEVRSRGYENIDVVPATEDDSGLPSGQIDLVFLCNVYHHVENRIDYFDALREKLRPDGLVAIVDVRGGVPFRWLTPPGHSTPREDLLREMDSARYRPLERFDFLPLQDFVIFAPRP